MPMNRVAVWAVLAGIAGLAACEPAPETEEGVPAGEVVEEEAPAEAAAPDFRRWDADNDGDLTVEEFGPWVRQEGVLADWDDNGDGYVGVNEFGSRIFELWDMDHDGGISEAEWRDAVGAWYPEDVEYGTFGDWDLNNDNVLERDEVVGAVNRTRVYAEWDEDDDALVDEEEFIEGYFGVYDENNDELLTQSEWRRAVDRWRMEQARR